MRRFARTVFCLWCAGRAISAELPNCAFSERERQLVLETAAEGELRNTAVFRRNWAAGKNELIVYKSSELLRVTGLRWGIDVPRGILLPYYKVNITSGRIESVARTVSARSAMEAIADLASPGETGAFCSHSISDRELRLANAPLPDEDFRRAIEGLRGAIQSELGATYREGIQCSLAMIRPGRLERVIFAEAICGAKDRVVLEATRVDLGFPAGAKGLWDPASASQGDETLRQLSERPQLKSVVRVGR